MGENYKKLILVGGGGHCKAVIDVAMSSNRPIFGILDNAISCGDNVAGVPVIGCDNDIQSIIAKHGNSIEFLITVGQIKSPAIRKKLVDSIKNLGGTLAKPVIASTAHIAIGAEIGCGTVVMHNTVVNTDAKIGENCIINTGAIIEHDTSIGDFTHVSTGAIINGASHVGNDCFIGSHATIANVKSIASATIIGAGTVIIEDITEAGTYCGVPAKLIH